MLAVIEKYERLPFRWGQADCCTFVGEALCEMTGTNPNFAYSTKAEVADILSDHGGLEGAITARLGAPYFGYAEGYVALVDNGESQAAGVIWHGRIICRTPGGLVDLPTHRALKVWRPWQP